MNQIVPVRRFTSSAEMLAHYAKVRRTFNGPRKPMSAPAPVMIAPPDPEPMPEPAERTDHELVVQLTERVNALQQALVDMEIMFPEVIAQRATVGLIARIVAAHRGVTVIDIKSQRRARKVSIPRQEAMYLATILTVRSLPEIGYHLNRDHTTVLHARNVTVKRMEADPAYAAEIAELKGKVEAHVRSSIKPGCAHE